MLEIRPVLQSLRIHQRRNFNRKSQLTHSYVFKPGNLVLSHATLGQIADKAAADAGDQTAFVSPYQGIRKTYQDFKTAVDKLASGLISLGLQKGDRVGLCAPNIYEWPITQFATAKAGLIMFNVNPAYQASELEYCLKKVGCKALITSDVLKTQNFYDMLCSFVPELPNSKPGTLQSKNIPTLRNVILIGNETKSGTITFEEASNAGDSKSDKILGDIEKNVQFDEPVNIQFTSGTTGYPKGATLSHHNIVNNVLVVGHRLGYHEKKPTVCCPVPFYHCFGCVLGTLGSVMFQHTLVLPSPVFDASANIESVQNEGCTAIYGTPTMYVELLRKYNPEKHNLKTLKQAIIGGASCPESVVKEIYSKLDIPRIHIAYGSTENSPAVAGNTLDDEPETVASGFIPAIEYVEMKVVDQTGKVVPVNSQGELCARGHILYMGYWNDKEKTKEVVDKTNWYHTGDIALMREDGYIRITGRIKDMVIRGGENLYPLEIEHFLHKHSSILEAHICGVPDEKMGEEMCAWILLKDGTTLTEQDIRDFCKTKISHFKIPRYIMFVKEFPKTVSGKIQKYKMRESSIKTLGLS